MERDIRTLAKELEIYYLQITKKPDNDNSLTTIQKIEYQNSIRKVINAKGIEYTTLPDYDAPQRITFFCPTWYINEIGVIKDVLPKGAFPFSLSVDNDIIVSYDPRNLKDENRQLWNDLSNTEFLNLQKGSEYQFKGKVSFCHYYFAEKSEKFYFQITGDAPVSKGGNCFIATVCYGDYNAPEVLVLRKYRDDKLLKTYFGKLFIAIYYIISPSISAIIAKSGWIKKTIRYYFLQPIVENLRRQNKH